MAFREATAILPPFGVSSPWEKKIGNKAGLVLGMGSSHSGGSVPSYAEALLSVANSSTTAKILMIWLRNSLGKDRPFFGNLRSRLFCRHRCEWCVKIPIGGVVEVFRR